MHVIRLQLLRKSIVTAIRHSSSRSSIKPFSGSRSAEHVVVAMSGGVDSSVAAHMLQRQGFKVSGLFMRNWDPDDELGAEACTQDQDWGDVQRVCAQLSIPCDRVDFSRAYWLEVFAPSLEVFKQGLTPNPDALCNARIKFRAFRQHALDVLGADYLATGHYARLLHTAPSDPAPPQLLTAVDQLKDQSYFLSGVPHQAFKRVLFPLGGMLKTDVRQYAAEAGLATAAKRDSAGLCFVGRRRRFGEFLSQYLQPTAGQFICVETGAVLGAHDGLELYTIGQAARLSGASVRWFVVSKDLSTGDITVAPGTDHPSLLTDNLVAAAADFSWVAGHPPISLADGHHMRVLYKVRYRTGRDAATLQLRNGLLHMQFDQPERGITPQQMLVVYGGDHENICLGGGPILSPGVSHWDLQ